jgi:hypothetical protein
MRQAFGKDNFVNPEDPTKKAHGAINAPIRATLRHYSYDIPPHTFLSRMFALPRQDRDSRWTPVDRAIGRARR